MEPDRLRIERTSRSARTGNAAKRWENRDMAPDRDTGTADAEEVQGLALYGYPQCPFCRRVLNEVESLGLEIPLRNTMQEAEHQHEVVEAMGRGTVPVLRIEGASGEVEWLPESADIVRYLRERFDTDAAAGGGASGSKPGKGFIGWLAKLFRPPLPPS